MPKLIQIKTTQPNNEMNITWAPTNLCNFKCRYCWPGANEGNYLPIKNVDLVTKNMDCVLKEFTKHLNKEHFKINFAGGEPTLWNGLEQVIQELNKNHKIYWGRVTNGSRTYRWWDEYGHLFDSVQVSYHITQTDINHTIQLCDLLFERGVKVTVRVMMDVLNWDKGVEVIEFMKSNSKHRWFIDVAEVIEDHLQPSSIPIYKDGRVYNEEQREFLKNQNKRVPGYSWLKKNINLIREGKIKLFESYAHYDDGAVEPAKANYYMNRKLNYFKGWKCNIGLERIYIDYDGGIKGSCGQHIFDNCNILDEDFIEKFVVGTEPVTCEIKACNCGPEMHITKSIVF
jgi:MoaA/NifB/PqqE/SkfB family radical SAM enzyme